LGELSALLAHSRGRVATHVLFLRPPRVGLDWVQTDLWRSAQALRDVDVKCDDEGIEAQRFGAETSGFTVLYDTEGRLRFQGGITSGRGHAGDNVGRDKLLAILLKEEQRVASTHVYGCSLSNDGLNR
jgi:hypothetical protein